MLVFKRHNAYLLLLSVCAALGTSVPRPIHALLPQIYGQNFQGEKRLVDGRKEGMGISFGGLFS